MGIDAIVGLVTSIIGRIWPDKSEQQKLQFAKELQQAIIDSDLQKAQISTNTAEASNPNIFVSGWRPWIGWGLGTIVIFYAFFTLLINFSIALGYNVIQFPPLDPMVRDIVMGMLGLNIGARSFDKYKSK